jgi:YbgC/YbaW family acyl-CoA thioester hydrolase
MISDLLTLAQTIFMSRIKIALPSTFGFTAHIPVRITDVNYGGHVGNDSILGIIHEARMQFLAHHGLSEMQFGGVSLIMADAGIEFKAEVFYGDTVIAAVAMENISKVGFDLFYRLEKNDNGKTVPVALAKTAMVCFDYNTKKIVAMPDDVKRSFLH